MVDAFAAGCVGAVREAGRTVPADVLVATRYDGLLARTRDPPLTAGHLHLGLVALAQLEDGPREVAPVPVQCRRRRCCRDARRVGSARS